MLGHERLEFGGGKGPVGELGGRRNRLRIVVFEKPPHRCGAHLFPRQNAVDAAGANQGRVQLLQVVRVENENVSVAFGDAVQHIENLAQGDFLRVGEGRLFRRSGSDWNESGGSRLPRLDEVHQLRVEFGQIVDALVVGHRLPRQRRGVEEFVEHLDRLNVRQVDDNQGVAREGCDGLDHLGLADAGRALVQHRIGPGPATPLIGLLVVQKVLQVVLDEGRLFCEKVVKGGGGVEFVGHEGDGVPRPPSLVPSLTHTGIRADEDPLRSVALLLQTLGLGHDEFDVLDDGRGTRQGRREFDADHNVLEHVSVPIGNGLDPHGIQDRRPVCVPEAIRGVVDKQGHGVGGGVLPPGTDGLFEERPTIHGLVEPVPFPENNRKVADKGLDFRVPVRQTEFGRETERGAGSDTGGEEVLGQRDLGQKGNQKRHEQGQVREPRRLVGLRKNSEKGHEHHGCRGVHGPSLAVEDRHALDSGL